MITMCICEYCGREFTSKYALGGHQSHCKLNPDYSVEKDLKGSIKGLTIASEKKHLAYLEQVANEAPKYCLQCGKQLDKIRAHNGAKFCNSSCAAKYNNAHNKVTEKQRKQKSERLSRSIRRKYTNGEILPTNSIYKSSFKISDDFVPVEDLIANGTIINDENFRLKIENPKNPKFINIKNIVYHKCEYCGREFYARITKHGNIQITKTCCEKCRLELNKQKSREIQHRLIAEGRHQGWKSRNIKSFAEKFWIDVLNNNNIPFIADDPFIWGRAKAGERFFLDFHIMFNGKNIDLEIDGKQHTYEDRKEHDIWRDSLITKAGIDVYRIPWNEINTDAGKQLMKDKIDKFLSYLYNGD